MRHRKWLELRDAMSARRRAAGRSDPAGSRSCARCPHHRAYGSVPRRFGGLSAELRVQPSRKHRSNERYAASSRARAIVIREVFRHRATAETLSPAAILVRTSSRCFGVRTGWRPSCLPVAFAGSVAKFDLEGSSKRIILGKSMHYPLPHRSGIRLCNRAKRRRCLIE
jgi:hypothetical protein